MTTDAGRNPGTTKIPLPLRAGDTKVISLCVVGNVIKLMCTLNQLQLDKNMKVVTWITWHKFLNYFSAAIDFRRHNLTSLDVRLKRYIIELKFSATWSCVPLADQVGENYIRLYHLSQNICQSSKYNAHFSLKCSCLAPKGLMVDRYSVKRSDVTRRKQGYIAQPLPYFILRNAVTSLGENKVI